jgi:hypothetical protein
MLAGAVCPRISGEAIRALLINISSHAILNGSKVSTKSRAIHRAGFDNFRFGLTLYLHAIVGFPVKWNTSKEKFFAHRAVHNRLAAVDVRHRGAAFRCSRRATRRLFPGPHPES